MSDFMRMIYNSGQANNYPRNGTTEEKLSSKLIEKLSDSASLFNVSDEDTIVLIISSQMYGLQEAVDREYSIINGEILIETSSQ